GCGGGGRGAERAFFGVAEGGGLRCRRGVPAHQPVRPVGVETAALLARLATEPLAQAAPARGLEEAARVTEELLASVTSGPVRSRAVLARTRIASPTAPR